MTLDGLAYAVRRTAVDLERWAKLGALGDRWREDRDRGKWRHITKEIAGRVIIMDRLLVAGLTEDKAAIIASTYVRKDHWPNDKIRATSWGVVITVDLAELDLP